MVATVIRSAVKTNEVISRIFFSQNSVRGDQIEDHCIYRMNV